MSHESKPISVGIVGIGTHGMRYARHIQRDVDGLSLLGVYQRDETLRRERADELGTSAFDSARALIEAADAVVIVTPPPSHVELINLALDCGTYALVEKPVTCNANEAAPLLERDRAAGGKLMAAHTLRYDGVISAVAAQLEHIAPVHYIRMAQRLSPSSLEWQQSLDTSGGGSVLLTGVHLFDTVAWFTNEPITIRHAQTERVLNPATEDFFISVGSTDSGVHVSMEVSKYTTHRACFVEVVGERGQLWGDYHARQAFIGRDNDRVPLDTPDVHTVASALKDFDAWMRGRIDNAIPFADGVRAVALADQCYKLAGR